MPQAKGGSNQHTNIVATCFDANAAKNDKDADEFARHLYREEMISLNEFNQLKDKISDLGKGNIPIDLDLVREIVNKEKA